MRLYHYMPAKYGLARRLKIAELEDLNDPFELRSIQLSGPDYEVDDVGFRKGMAQSSGFLCFSAAWNNMLMWSHYADRHRGICIGFDGDIGNQMFTQVAYRERIQPTPPLEGLNEEKMRQLISTKSKDWSYEKEWRVFPTVQDPEWCDALNRNLEFVGFGDLLTVREVLFGVRCTMADEECAKTLCPSAKFRRLQMHSDKFRLI